ncbi:dihydroxy-acid dehydratase (plasmid) [Rhizobium sp. NIBRBAC000502774]|nr:dihydroxy-acid dehydratase [Rhizobium sp. NIBRBAC000502774]
MTEDQVPEFVDAIIATGCPICAVGHELYVFAEIDLPPEDIDRVSAEVHNICTAYGERDHLRREIAAYLRSLGRYVECEISTVH